MDTAKTHVLPDGTALHYRIRRAEREPRGCIVLLHGMASNLTRWSEFVEQTTLKRDWNILRPDLRGHGESFMRGRIGMEIWSRDLVELLDTECCEQAVLIGHSLGAHLALHAAARYPSRIRALVLIDPVFPSALRGTMRVLRMFRWVLYPLVALIRLLNALGIRRREVRRRDMRVLDEQVRAELLSAGNSSAFVRRYSSPFEDLKYFPLSHYVQEIAEMLRSLPTLATIRMPILVLLSRAVTYTNPAATERELATAPDAERRTIDAYHWPLTEQPEQVRSRIEAWFATRLA
jgi:pimeloyl-ACP methyl ester carboxylesterase